jgi:hypothetical protein
MLPYIVCILLAFGTMREIRDGTFIFPTTGYFNKTVHSIICTGNLCVRASVKETKEDKSEDTHCAKSLK